MVAPVLAEVFEAQKSRLCRWLGKCYIGGEKLVSMAARGGLYSRRIACIPGTLRVFENKPPP